MVSVQVALADGSVKWINDSIDYETWQYLGDRADGEVSEEERSLLSVPHQALE